MSIKEFFAFSIIKPQVIEFLKNKGDFESLGAKYKKPFRGHIIREENSQSSKFDQKNSPQKSKLGPFGPIPVSKNEVKTEKYYISDGFN